jgi:DegV family protein with EDD domain
MVQVRIITDSTAYLDPAFIAAHGITVLPVEVDFGGEKFIMDSQEPSEPLFRRMAERPAQAVRATVPASVFQRAYDRLNRETEEILVILSSSRLSSAFEEARLATRTFLGRCRIVVLDSMSASWGLGLVVRAAARAAEQGRPMDDIVRLVRGMLPHIYLVFLVERLDYLELGGRIDPAQALLGTMLHIKPLLFVEDGDIISLEKVRTRLLAIEKLASFVAEFAMIQQVVLLKSPLQNSLNELIDELREQLRLDLPNHRFPAIDYDPILACHLGPEALGIAVYEGTREDGRLLRNRGLDWG